MLAAARACAHDARVAGLLRNARSTTSTSESCRIRSCRSGGTAAATAGITTGSGLIAPAGAFHGMLGDGDAPAAPLTRGGVPQPATTSTSREIAWQVLGEGDIIPNTP